MRKISLKKLNIATLAFVLMLSNVATFADANIIIAPTKATETVPAYSSNTYSDSVSPGNVLRPVAEEYQDSVVSPASQVISAYTYDTATIDNISILDIVEDNNNYYCYQNGALVRDGWRKISRRSFAEFAPVDAYDNDYIWAFFTSNGRAIKAGSEKIRKATIGDNTYAFNEYGQLLVGFFNDNGEMWNESTSEDPFDLLDDRNSLYHADESTGILTVGWYHLRNTTSRYPNKDSIWLYFNPSTFKITRSTGNNYKSQKINGYNYAFDDKGVMLTGFEASQYNEDHGGSTKTVYFASDGRELRDGFFNVDLSDDYSYERYEEYDDSDEDITIYLSKSGQVYKNMIKKIGSGYYGFDENGVLLRGLTIWNNSNYVATIDTESTNGKSFISSGIYKAKNGGSAILNDSDVLHYFDYRGKKVTSGKIDFGDNIYTYEANNSGAINGVHNKKYYVHGLLMKPEDSKYGVYIQNPTQTNYTMAELANTYNVVVNSSGTVQSGSPVFKDDDDKYWLVSGSTLKNVYTASIKKNGNKYYFRSTNPEGKDAWIPFGEKDIQGKTCVEEILPNGTRLGNGAISSFQTKITSDQAMNFYIK